MKYDDASWHFGGDYPRDLPQTNAFTHIGVFLAWAIKNGLAGELHTEEWPEEIGAVENRVITGAEFLAKNCDGKLTDEDLNEQGNAFASEFYENDYFGIYSKLLILKDYTKRSTTYLIPGKLMIRWLLLSPKPSTTGREKAHNKTALALNAE